MYPIKRMYVRLRGFDERGVAGGLFGGWVGGLVGWLMWRGTLMAVDGGGMAWDGVFCFAIHDWLFHRPSLQSEGN